MKTLILTSFLFLFFSCNKQNINTSITDDCWSPPNALPENDGVVYSLAFMKNDTDWVVAN